MSPYDSRFYSGQELRSAKSAKAFLPFLLKFLQPRSALDVGCGTGVWLREMEALGVETVHGIDGPWVPAGRRRLDPGQFTAHDFGAGGRAPDVPLDRYDIVMSYEFLEHVDAERADDLVAFMCSKADILVVGAAPPHQGGTHHVNEQWPSYWAEKFARHGFKPFDFLRYALWDNQEIAPWYIQNTIVYFRGEVPAHIVEFGRTAIERHLWTPASLAHPGVFSKKLGLFRNGLKNPPKILWQLLLEEFRKRKAA